MDKYEYKIRSDEIKNLIAAGAFVQAAEIADTIDWRRVKSVMMLCTISDLYKINRRYEDAKNMLLLAYERKQGSRTICYSLCELCIKTGEFVQAVNYYKEYVQVAPKDSGRYILQYKLYEAQEVSLEERISVLEELKKKDYREKWAYELAYLYHRVGLATRCVEECDELILWFGDGKYVVKAMELKMLHQPLSPDQQEKYDHRFDKAEQAEYGDQGDEHSQPQPDGQWDGYGQPQPDGQWDGYGQPQPDGQWDGYGQPQPDGQWDNYGQPADGQYADSGQSDAGFAEESDELDIQVKTIDVGQYNTINLQAELAAGLQEVLGAEEINHAITAPALNPDMEAAGNQAEITEKEEAAEVFFGETGEVKAAEDQSAEDDIKSEDNPAEENRAKILYMPDRKNAFYDEENKVEIEIQPENDKGIIEEEEALPVRDDTAEMVLTQMRMESGNKAAGDTELFSQPLKELADVLSLEADGQIGIVMPESVVIEKQITGQMKLEDILAEWERTKKDNEEKNKEDVRKHVMQETGSMFTEFEAAVRDGLLERLEKGEAVDENLLEQPEQPLEPLEEEELQEPLKEVLTEEAEEAWEEVLEEEQVKGRKGEFLERKTVVGGLAAEEAKTTEDTEEAEFAEEDGEEPAGPEALAEPPVLANTDMQGKSDGWDESSETSAESIGTEEAVNGWDDTTELSDGTKAAQTFSGEEDTEAEDVQTSEEKESSPSTVETAKDMPQDEVPIVRDVAKVRGLTREEKELFAPFIQSRSARENLVKMVDNISMAAYTGNVVVTGEEGMDTMTFAKNIIRELQMMDRNFSGKVAKISGQGLNQRNIEETLWQLNNGALIIYQASGMKPNTASMLHQQLQQENLGIVVVLEDTKKAIQRMFLGTPELFGDFTARMDLEALSNDTLVSFGRRYAREMEYSIDDLGVLALHTRIEELQTIDHVVTVVEVKKIVDDAIRHACRKTLGHFFDILLAKRYDEEDMIILTEKDFA